MGTMRVLTGLMVLMLPAYGLHAQGDRYVQLKNSRMDYAPRTFYLASVTDDRRSDGVGTLSSNGRRQHLVIQNGTVAAFDRYISGNIKQDHSRQAIVLHVQQLDFDIKRKNNLWSLDATVTYAFYAGDKKLVEYTGNSRGEINTDPAEYAERFMRQSLESDMKKFDAWWGQNSDMVPTASTVKVNFIISKTTDEPDLIVYSTSRPVTIGDFQGRPGRNPSEMAATFSGNKYAYKTATRKGQIVVDYIITPYFNKSKSWFKQSEQNAHVLAHEQTHFDITALKTCELVNKMRNVTFTKNNYQELLEHFSDQVSDETNEMQERYDNETDHGIKRAEQAAWSAKVKEQLKIASCY